MRRYTLKLFQVYSFVLLALALSACQSLTTQDVTSTNALAANQKLVNWRAEGKIKIELNGETHSAAFDWQQHKDNYVIHFFGPFGAGSSWLRRTSKGVTLELPDRPVMRAKTPERLLLDAVGWNAPISLLQYWIKGIPAPHTSSTASAEVDANGVLFEQADWKIQAERLKPVNGFLLPGKITGTDGNTSVTVIVKQWEPR